MRLSSGVPFQWPHWGVFGGRRGQKPPQETCSLLVGVVSEALYTLGLDCDPVTSQGPVRRWPWAVGTAVLPPHPTLTRTHTHPPAFWRPLPSLHLRWWPEPLHHTPPRSQGALAPDWGPGLGGLAHTARLLGVDCGPVIS